MQNSLIRNRDLLRAGEQMFPLATYPQTNEPIANRRPSPLEYVPQKHASLIGRLGRGQFIVSSPSNSEIT